MDVLSCASYNFMIPCGVSLYSLYKNSENQDLHFHIIIDESVSNAQVETFYSFFCNNLHCKLSFYNINVNDIKQYLIEVNNRFRIPIYYRLLMANIIPSNIEKIIYIDSDVLVRHDLTELWNYDISDYTIAAVENQSDGSCFYKRLNYPKEIGYFNSGVLLVNLKKWREQSLSDCFIDYIKCNPEKLINPDQDVLNYVLKDTKMNLPLKYNVQEAFYRIEMNSKLKLHLSDVIEARENPYILHFTELKPWEKLCNHPLKQLFFIYKRETPWDKDCNIHYTLIEKIKRTLHHLNILSNEQVYISIRLKK